jgi:steroid delta-isomerase-like uncharacterized protein
MKSTSAKQLVTNYMHALWNGHDLSAVNHTLADECVAHTTVGEKRGVEAMREVAQLYLKAMPDIHLAFNHVIEGEGNIVAVHWCCYGTHQGEFLGIPPSGREIRYSGVTIHRVEEGKVLEYWAYVDVAAIKKQMQAVAV